MKFNSKLLLYFVTISQVVAGRELSTGRRLRKGKPPKRKLQPGLNVETTSAATITPEDLVQALLKPDSNLIISNVQYVGAPHAAGVFSASTGNIFGFEEGIVLTTGDIKDIEGPNERYNTTTNNDLPGDVDLDKFFFANTRMSTYDATSLSFEFECDGIAEVSFRYVFASEEYNEYVGSTYNDVFAFFLNGENVALLPDGENTAINSVHCGNPSPLDGSPAVPASPNCNLFIDNTDNHVYTEMDGLTTVLTAEGDAHGGVNSIKLVIADVADGKFDSAVLLESGSFNCILPTPPPTLPPTPPPTPQPTPQPTPGPTLRPTIKPVSGWVGKHGATAGATTGSIADIAGGGTADGGGGGDTISATAGRGSSTSKASGEGAAATHGVAGGEGFGGSIGIGYGHFFGGEGSGNGNTGGATFGDSGGGGGGMGQAKTVTMGQNSLGGATGAGNGAGDAFGTANIGSFSNGFGEGFGYSYKQPGEDRRRNRRRNLQWIPVAGGEGGGTGAAFQNSNAAGIGAAGGGGGASVFSAKRGHSIASGGGSGTFGAFGHTEGMMNGNGGGTGLGSIDEDGNTMGLGESFGTTGGFANGEAGGGGMGSGWSNAQSNGQLAGAGSFGGGEGHGLGTGETTGGAMSTGFADGYAELHYMPVAAPVATPTAE